MQASIQTPVQTAAHQKEFPMTATLYQRLGSAEGIARLVDDVIDAHLATPSSSFSGAAIQRLNTVNPKEKSPCLTQP